MNNRLIDDFIGATAVSRKEAIYYLQNQSYDYENALDMFFKHTNGTLWKIFELYKDTPSSIEIDGTLKYLKDLEIEPEDIESLVLSYFLKSSSMGHFDKLHFFTQWTRVKINTLAKMKDFIRQLTYSIKVEDKEFDGLYEYIFGFLLENPNQRTVAYDLLVDYWKLLFSFKELDEGTMARLDQWYTFLESVGKPLNKDSYLMFWEFVKEVVVADPDTFKGYDEMASWPVIIDEFVEYLQENGLLQSSEST